MRGCRLTRAGKVEVQSAPKHPVPVFPLPSLVLFPHAMLPLHIFELRYRTMVRDALSAERMIAVVLLKPGWERDYYGSPEFYELGCLARFDEVEWLPNDCYDLRVVGLSRVHIDRTVREYPYRAARLSVLPQEPYPEEDPLIQMEKRALLETFERWRKAGEVESGREVPAVSESLVYETLVNAMCMVTEASPLERLNLLEMDSGIERGRRVRELTEDRLKRRAHQLPGDGAHN